MAEISGFTADLYCDHPKHEIICGLRLNGEVDGEYVHPSRRGPAIAQAKRDGWLFKRNGETYCPKCSGKKSGE